MWNEALPAGITSCLHFPVPPTPTGDESPGSGLVRFTWGKGSIREGLESTEGLVAGVCVRG